ncbi:MAG: amino acid adenylation domain-containing protein [Stigonema ocellatum SAG 48.90 = DSM 106950]|nr:amino acid adenylation domain-containing protein [Stigonema ocellatum SAG 48.90 = DSM 106950]
MDTDWLPITSQSESVPLSAVTSSDLAYVIYTSGSTGLPKGVQISHQSVVNFLDTMRISPGLSDTNTFLAVTTIGFDIAALELYLPLIVGAKVVVVSREIASDGTKLLTQLVVNDTTAMQATPATWQMLLTSGWSNSHPVKVFCGGEALPSTLAKQLLATGSEVWNLYGPTEATIWSAVHKVGDIEQIEAQTKDSPELIGHPIANTQIYILDSYLQPVPIGVKGELYIGGAGLACGYLNRPDLTEEKFIPNPFSNEPFSRLYKTGDLARYQKDGNIEFLGRIDHQVKIRGFRIELGEIEAALLNGHSGVREAVVLAREDKPGNKRLVAYIVPHLEPPSSSELHRFLKQKLPEYMMPSAFVILDHLPLTPNGKVDRRALSAPDIDFSGKTPFVAPCTPTQEVIASIIAELLEQPKVGIHDNFFAMGGHSLLATQVISRLRQIFSADLPLRYIFEFPTVAELEEAIKAHSQSGLELIAPAIEPVARDTDLPLSWAQQRLWFLDQLEEQSASYNMPAVVQITGDLKVVALEQALEEIVQRHEVLRTNFQPMNGVPIQVIAPVATVNLLILDLQGLPEAQQSVQVQQLAAQEVQKPFNLAEGLLLRVSLLRLGEQSHVLLLVMHHIISDAWSLGILIQELSALYTGYLTGKYSGLAELTIQYADFAVWQRQWLSGQAYAAHLEYWQQHLAGAPPIIELPTDRPRPPHQTYHGSRRKFQIQSELHQKLKTLSHKSGTTLFMTLEAAFVTLLYRYSGQEDIVIGTPIANRNHPEIEPLIGFFVNTLVLRNDLSGNPSFVELLARVRQVALQAYAHQDVPFEQVVEALQPERNLSHSPLFQVMFDWQNAPVERRSLPGLALTPLSIEDAIAKFDLTLSMEESVAQGLVGAWEYNTDLFDEETIARMAVHFQTLLAAIVAHPEQSISELQLLSEPERHQLLVEWNDTQKDYPDKCIHQLFEEQVQRTPDAVAVVFFEEQLTYDELNSRANKLAHHLQKMGVAPETLVGICMERSVEMIVGLLGILKAGGAYVPLDPAYPQERLDFMLSNSQVSILLTQEKLAAQMPGHSVHLIFLDQDWEVISAESQENLSSGVISENLAYVIYTSGSTGIPKGVAIAHSSLTNTYLAWEESYDLRARTTSHLQMASVSFDVFSGDLVRALCSGGKLILCPREWLVDPEKLYGLIRDQEIDSAEFVPAVLSNLISYLKKTDECLNFMRLLVVGSDSWHVKQYEEFQRFFGQQTRLINSYGVTEAAIDSCYFESAEVKLPIDQLVPIGRPIANTQIYILDHHLQPLPVGIPGELHIGGVGLARGYLNRPDLTTEKFIPNPFSNQPKSRLYKTGDLARYQKDGNIEFLGRIDHQVKVRGFRIELGEIEAEIAQHPQVRQAVVIAREDQPGNKHLVAYIVPNSNSLDSSELRSLIKKKLPNYMLPSSFVILDTLPLSPNGKIDRSALPAPSRSIEEESFVLPRTATEEVIASIIAEVLALEQVGIYDNFFELGGHSLLATQVISRLRQAFLVELPLSAIFESATIAELAEVVVAKQIEEADSEALNQILAEVDDLSDIDVKLQLLGEDQ